MCQLCGFVRHTGLSQRGPSQRGPSRRALFGGGLAALALARPALAASGPTPEGMSPDLALRTLMEGNARFVADRPTHCNFNTKRIELLDVQRPIVVVLGCSDSRVEPESTFDQSPGQVFVVRVAGNVLNEDGAATLEYAVQFLGVRLIMVLGHRNCGAVAAAIQVVKDGSVLPGHLPGLIDSIKPAVVAAAAKKPTDLAAAATAENVRHTMGNITASAPILSAATATGRVKVVGAVADIANGQVHLL